MAERSDLYRNTYSQFNEHVLEIIRKETFGVDIGQNSWLTVDEYDRFVSWLRLMPESHLLGLPQVPVVRLSTWPRQLGAASLEWMRIRRTLPRRRGWRVVR